MPEHSLSALVPYLEFVGKLAGTLTALYGAYALISRLWRGRPYRKLISVLDPQRGGEFKIFLSARTGKRVSFETYLDFSVGSDERHRMLTEGHFDLILPDDASELNGVAIPLPSIRSDGRITYLDTLTVEMQESRRLKWSAGGTGIRQILFRGTFEIETRAYSGPRVDYTLREVAGHMKG